MDFIHKLCINNVLDVDGVEYTIMDIKVIKTGKCFRDHYDNNYLFQLKNKKTK